MDKNNKFNKIKKNINNNNEILDVKYKERDDLLKNYEIIKPEELEDLNKYIENIELENKNLVKELENFKKDDLNINFEKNKTKLCKYYESPKGCDKGNNCYFAHGENELKNRIKSCISGLKCYKKECEYYHPEGWNYKKNVKICDYYMDDGYCKYGDNCYFKHINENIEKSIEINKEDNKTEKINNHIKDVIKYHLHENIVYDIIENVKNNNRKKEKLENDLSINCSILINGIEFKDVDINSINEDVNPSIQKKIKNNNFENFSYGSKYNKLNIIESTKIRNNNEIQDLIIKLQETFEKYTKEIKNNIDEIFVKDKTIYGINMKIKLNEIISEIKLFKNNYEDNRYNKYGLKIFY